MTTACASYYRDSDITTSGALTHRYYVRDYLGSTRAVVDEDGNVLQSTAYYPSGVPLTPNSFTPQTVKHPFNKAWVLPNNSTVIRKGEIDIEISNEIIDYIKQLLYE